MTWTKREQSHKLKKYFWYSRCLIVIAYCCWTNIFKLFSVFFLFCRLKGIQSFVTPDLFAALSDAGFGDQIVLASSSFPSATLARPSESASLIRMDGQTVETVLEEIMKFIKVNLFSRFFKVFENTYRKITFLILIVTVTFHRRIQLFNI